MSLQTLKDYRGNLKSNLGYIEDLMRCLRMLNALALKHEYRVNFSFSIEDRVDLCPSWEINFFGKSTFNQAKEVITKGLKDLGYEKGLEICEEEEGFLSMYFDETDLAKLDPHLGVHIDILEFWDEKGLNIDAVLAEITDWYEEGEETGEELYQTDLIYCSKTIQQYTKELLEYAEEYPEDYEHIYIS